MKALFFFVLMHMGHEHIDPNPMTLEHCVARLMSERAALAHVQLKHPEQKEELACRPKS